MRAHGCRLTGKMTGGRPTTRLGPSAITLDSTSVMALAKRGSPRLWRGGLSRVRPLATCNLIRRSSSQVNASWIGGACGGADRSSEGVLEEVRVLSYFVYSCTRDLSSLATPADHRAVQSGLLALEATAALPLVCAPVDRSCSLTAASALRLSPRIRERRGEFGA